MSYAPSFTTGCRRSSVPRRGRLGWGKSLRTRQLKTMLAPYPSDEMNCWPVSVRVGYVNNDTSLVEPISAQ